jgi:glucan phosphoethanolaminetransferase (alkaline phosphatase superfamily)
LNPDVILLAINTNIEEATELGKGYMLGYLAMMLIMLAIYIFLAGKLPAKLPAKKSLYISLISAGIFMLLPFIHWSEESYFTRMKGSLYSTFPVSFLYSAGKVYTYYRNMHNNEQARNNFRFHVKQEKPPDTKQIYVLIIGESSRAGQWAINGYSRNTSPRLLKRTNLISFPNTTAGAYITEYAVPILITEATPNNFDLQDKERSIVSAFKEVGFNTYWMSNQIDEGHILVHAREADQTTISMETNRLDMDIVNKTLIKVLNKNEDKTFIVIHTWGDHWAYFERYPPSFDIFKPSAKYLDIKPTDASQKELIINSYDNSILYADAVIDSVISLVNQREACSTVFFISDHGEDLFDDARQRFMHGESDPSKYVAHIPFFIWYSDKYKELFPEKIKWLYKNKNRKISAEDVFPTLADMGSLRFPSLDTTKSIVSPSFRDSEQKILGANSIIYSYDSILKE